MPASGSGTKSPHMDLDDSMQSEHSSEDEASKLVPMVLGMGTSKSKVSQTEAMSKRAKEQIN